MLYIFSNITSNCSENTLTVNGNVMASGVCGLQGCGVTDGAGAHNEQGCLCLVLSKDRVEARRVWRRTIYGIRRTNGYSCGWSDDLVQVPAFLNNVQRQTYHRSYVTSGGEEKAAKSTD